MMNAPAIRAQAQSSVKSMDTAAPKFEVAAINACENEAPDNHAPDSGTGRKGGKSGYGSPSPGRLILPCTPVRFLIRIAYVFSNRQWDGDPSSLQIQGGPARIDSDRYRITAKSGTSCKLGRDGRPHASGLLEGRFQLKMHRVAREVPLYALTVAESGLKLQQAGNRSCTEPDAFGDGRPFLLLGCSKIQLAEEGGCTPIDLAQSPPPPLEPGQKPPCGIHRGSVLSHQHIIDLFGASMARISQTLGASGRPVIDKTGIKVPGHRSCGETVGQLAHRGHHEHL